MAKRKSTGKRLRFEIFKRDGFRCVYCGNSPVETPLHVDHVLPVAEGGTNDPANLVTACQSCNGGKAAVPLEAKALPPRATAEEMGDHAEQIREYLAAQRLLDEARKAVVDSIHFYWEERIGGMNVKMYDRLGRISQEWPIETIHEAIEITAGRLGTPGQEYNPDTADRQCRYFQAILRNKREGITPRFRYYRG